MLCRCMYRPVKPFADFLQKIISGKTSHVKPSAKDLEVILV